MIYLLLILTISLTTVTATTKVSCYGKKDFKGNAVVLDNLENFGHYYFTVFNNKLISFRLDRGTCVIMDMNSPPSTTTPCAWPSKCGSSFWTGSSISNVGSTWEKRISTVRRCGTNTRDIQCPSGTFVKKIEWDNERVGFFSSSSLRKGIRLFCYQPSSKTPSAILYSHPGLNFQGGREECSGIRGITFHKDGNREAVVNIQPVCRPGSSSGSTFMCPRNSAISGMRLNIERYSNYIKSASAYCRDVGDITRICAAYDEKHILFECDATAAVRDFKCTHSKKVGISKTQSMSQSHSIAYTFYTEFGFDIGASGYGLSANFKAKVGQSRTTGYNWGVSQGTTWEKETTMTVEISAPPGCKTTVTEIVGSCSFLTVRPNIFYRNDTCKNGRSIITPVTIPTNFGAKVFTSSISI